MRNQGVDLLGHFPLSYNHFQNTINQAQAQFRAAKAQNNNPEQAQSHLASGLISLTDAVASIGMRLDIRA